MLSALGSVAAPPFILAVAAIAFSTLIATNSSEMLRYAPTRLMRAAALPLSFVALMVAGTSGLMSIWVAGSDHWGVIPQVVTAVWIISLKLTCVLFGFTLVWAGTAPYAARRRIYDRTRT